MLVRFFLLKNHQHEEKMIVSSVIPNCQFLNFILTPLHKTGNSHFYLSVIIFHFGLVS